MPCTVAVGYQRFEGSYRLQPEDGSSKALRNVCVLPQQYTASQDIDLNLLRHESLQSLIVYQVFIYIFIIVEPKTYEAKYR